MYHRHDRRLWQKCISSSCSLALMHTWAKVVLETFPLFYDNYFNENMFTKGEKLNSLFFAHYLFLSPCFFGGGSWHLTFYLPLDTFYLLPLLDLLIAFSFWCLLCFVKTLITSCTLLVTFGTWIYTFYSLPFTIYCLFVTPSLQLVSWHSVSFTRYPLHSEAFKFMHQNIVTKIKKYAIKDWIVLDVFIKDSVKILV